VSFEARNQYISGLVVYGSEGSIVLPDANFFGGDVLLRSGDEERAVVYQSRGAQETRGIGIEDLAAALAEGRPHRASAELALHVLEAADAVIRSADEGRVVTVG
jgi:predicted dehydrogenase